MAVIAGNALDLALGKQSGKATPQGTPQIRMRYISGFGPTPNRETIITAETDASRQEGDPVVVAIDVRGSSEHYVRPTENRILTHSLMGQTSTGGSGPYTHTSSSTSSGSAPYYTLYRTVNASSETTRMTDVQVSSITWRGGAGQALSATVEWFGLGSLVGQTDPGTPAAASESPLVYPQVTCTKNSSHDGSVASFEITANQNRTPWQGDSGTAPFDVVPGLYSVTGSLVMLFQSDADWRKFFTGSTSGTTLGTTIGTEPLNIIAAAGADDSISWDFDNIFITSYEPQHNTDGSPLTAAISFKSKRDATLANVLEVVTKSTTGGAP
jgi:hypothetical protein